MTNKVAVLSDKFLEDVHKFFIAMCLSPHLFHVDSSMHILEIQRQYSVVCRMVMNIATDNLLY